MSSLVAEAAKSERLSRLNSCVSSHKWRPIAAGLRMHQKSLLQKKLVKLSVPDVLSDRALQLQSEAAGGQSVWSRRTVRRGRNGNCQHQLCMAYAIQIAPAPSSGWKVSGDST